MRKLFNRLKRVNNKRGAAMISAVLSAMLLITVAVGMITAADIQLGSVINESNSLSSYYEAKTIADELAKDIAQGKDAGADGDITPLLTVISDLWKEKNNDKDPLERADVSIVGNVDNDRNTYTITMDAQATKIYIEVEYLQNGVKTKVTSVLKHLPFLADNDLIKEDMEKIFNNSSFYYLYDFNSDNCGNPNCFYQLHDDVSHHLHIRSDHADDDRWDNVADITVSAMPSSESDSDFYEPEQKGFEPQNDTFDLKRGMLIVIDSGINGSILINGHATVVANRDVYGPSLTGSDISTDATNPDYNRAYISKHLFSKGDITLRQIKLDGNIISTGSAKMIDSYLLGKWTQLEKEDMVGVDEKPDAIGIHNKIAGSLIMERSYIYGDGDLNSSNKNLRNGGLVIGGNLIAVNSTVRMPNRDDTRWAVGLNYIGKGNFPNSFNPRSQVGKSLDVGGDMILENYELWGDNSNSGDDVTIEGALIMRGKSRVTDLGALKVNNGAVLEGVAGNSNWGLLEYMTEFNVRKSPGINEKALKTNNFTLQRINKTNIIGDSLMENSEWKGSGGEQITFYGDDNLATESLVMQNSKIESIALANVVGSAYMHNSSIVIGQEINVDGSLRTLGRYGNNYTLNAYEIRSDGDMTLIEAQLWSTDTNNRPNVICNGNFTFVGRGSGWNNNQWVPGGGSYPWTGMDTLNVSRNADITNANIQTVKSFRWHVGGELRMEDVYLSQTGDKDSSGNNYFHAGKNADMMTNPPANILNIDDVMCEAWNRKWPHGYTEYTFYSAHGDKIYTDNIGSSRAARAPIFVYHAFTETPEVYMPEIVECNTVGWGADTRLIESTEDWTRALIDNRLTMPLKWNRPDFPGINDPINVDNAGADGYIEGRRKLRRTGDISFDTASSHVIDRNGRLESSIGQLNLDEHKSIMFDARASDLHVTIAAGTKFYFGDGYHFDVLGQHRVFLYIEDNVEFNFSSGGITGGSLAPNEGQDGLSTSEYVPITFGQNNINQIFAVAIGDNIKFDVRGATLNMFIYMPYSIGSLVNIYHDDDDWGYSIFGTVICPNIKSENIGIMGVPSISLDGIDFTGVVEIPDNVDPDDHIFGNIEITWDHVGYI